MHKITDHIFISSNFNDMNLELIHDFIKHSYWGLSRTFEEQKKASENTINFGLFKNNQQIAYARVMTDKVFFAYLLDVFVVPSEQKNGYAKLLIDHIITFPELQAVKKWMLTTKDAHTLYSKFGFTAIKSPENLMEKLNPQANKTH
ncbi:GNAT family N-acetyltransferase [Algibacter mikhailovii]|uniref:GNAT family N-acetyltransferase n=1 Tax=Algibacter mikhailovii TaxID=425498 RepID=UPI00249507B1|nr:GNAT family N-acetyltransferase [Algibacter mikhailovii]